MKDFVQRVIFNNQTIYSKDYTRMKKRNSYTVKFISSGGSTQFGFIQSFVRVKKFFLAIVQPFEVVSRSWSLSNKHNLPRRLSKYSLHDLAVHMHRIDMTVMLPFIAIPLKTFFQSVCLFRFQMIQIMPIYLSLEFLLQITLDFPRLHFRTSCSLKNQTPEF